MTITTQADPARNVRWTATAILGALLAVYVITSLPEEPSFWLLLIRAMAEAGMIGGLADWFAVEALFRRPLGLPIPHTALLPSNQKRAAENIARFINEYFLNPEQLIPEIRQFDAVGKAGTWLVRRENAGRVAREVSWALRVLMQTRPGHGVPEPVRNMMTETLGHAVGSGRLPDRLADLMKAALDTDFLDEVLARVRDAIDGNRQAVTELVQDRSRWWIASGVDRQVAGLLVDGVLSVLDELSDPASLRRAAFAASVHGIIDRFREDGTIVHLIDRSLTDEAGSPALSAAIDTMLEAGLREIDRKLVEEEEAMLAAVTQALRQIGWALVRDRKVHDTITARFEAALSPLLDAMRDPVRDYVRQTIANWNSADLVNRIETEVGRDLQFIRINGAVLGAMLGGFFFLVSHLLF